MYKFKDKNIEFIIIWQSLFLLNIYCGNLISFSFNIVVVKKKAILQFSKFILDISSESKINFSITGRFSEYLVFFLK